MSYEDEKDPGKPKARRTYAWQVRADGVFDPTEYEKVTANWAKEWAWPHGRLCVAAIRRRPGAPGERIYVDAQRSGGHYFDLTSPSGLKIGDWLMLERKSEQGRLVPEVWPLLAPDVIKRRIRTLAAHLDPCVSLVCAYVNSLGFGVCNGKIEIEWETDECFIASEASIVLADGSKLAVGLQVMFRCAPNDGRVSVSVYGRRCRDEDGGHLTSDERRAWLVSEPIDCSWPIEWHWSKAIDENSDAQKWPLEDGLPPALQLRAAFEAIDRIDLADLGIDDSCRAALQRPADAVFH